MKKEWSELEIRSEWFKRLSILTGLMVVLAIGAASYSRTSEAIGVLSLIVVFSGFLWIDSAVRFKRMFHKFPWQV
jgi:hypothetical protein